MQLLPWMHAQKNWQFCEFWSKMKHTQFFFKDLLNYCLLLCTICSVFCDCIAGHSKWRKLPHWWSSWKPCLRTWYVILTTRFHTSKQLLLRKRKCAVCCGRHAPPLHHPPPPPPSGISGLSFDFSFLSSFLFFCLVLILFLSCHISANGPFSWLFSQKIVSHFSLIHLAPNQPYQILCKGK